MPTFKMISLALLMAFAFIRALQNMVTPAIRALTTMESTIIRFSPCHTFERVTTMQAPPAPHRVEQMSPTTSAQKEQTFSEFCESLSADFEPFIFSFVHLSITFLSHEVAAMPIISNMTLIKTKQAIPIMAKNMPIEERRVCERNPKKRDIQIARISV